MQGGGRPCKFGDKCRNFAQGNCTFLHNSDGGNLSGGGGGRGGGYNPRNGPSNPDQNYGNPRQNNNYPTNDNYNDNKSSFGGRGGGRGGFGNNHNNYGKDYQNQGNPNQGGNPNQYHGSNNKPYNNNNPNQPNGSFSHNNKPNNYTSPTDDFSGKFCRNFHFDIPCKFQNKCSRKHGFDLEEQTKVRRVKFLRDVPTQNQSKLGKFVRDGKCYLVMRMGNGITIMSYNYETQAFDFLGEWKFPNTQIKYLFYEQHENFVYLSAQNPKTLLHDIVIYDMLKSQMIAIQNAHESVVTGIVHLTPEIILTGSKDGYIKVWKVVGTTATLDKESSEKVYKSYFQGKKIQLMFLNFRNIKGTNIITAGTNDNRVLFFIGDQMNFSQLVLGQKHANVYMIKYYISEQAIVGFVVTWAADKLSSGVVAIDLNDFKNNQVVSVDSKQNKRNNIYMIEVAKDKLFISYLNGTVNFYSLPAMEKTGAMLHGNFVNSIVENEHITSTNICINQLFLLESKFNDKPGSIGVYIMKQ